MYRYTTFIGRHAQGRLTWWRQSCSFDAPASISASSTLWRSTLQPYRPNRRRAIPEKRAGTQTRFIELQRRNHDTVVASAGLPAGSLSVCPRTRHRNVRTDDGSSVRLLSTCPPDNGNVAESIQSRAAGRWNNTWKRPKDSEPGLLRYRCCEPAGSQTLLPCSQCVICAPFSPTRFMNKRDRVHSDLPP